jgi:hypothetical protein
VHSAALALAPTPLTAGSHRPTRHIVFSIVRYFNVHRSYRARRVLPALLYIQYTTPVARSGWRVRSAVRDALTTPTGGGGARLPGCMNCGLSSSVAMKLLHGPTSVVSEEASAERQLVVVDGIPAEKALWYVHPPPLSLPRPPLGSGSSFTAVCMHCHEGGRKGGREGQGGVHARTHAGRQVQTDRRQKGRHAGSGGKREARGLGRH